MFGCGRTGVHFSRVDKHDASDRRYVLTSTIGKLLRALFNDSYHIALMRMGSKGVRDIGRMEQFKITQRGVMPEFDMLMGTHGSHVSLSPGSVDRFSRKVTPPALVQISKGKVNKHIKPHHAAQFTRTQAVLLRLHEPPDSARRR